MTNNNHPITPPTNLVIDWRLDPGYIECTEKVTMVTMTTGRLQYIATQAARWGADQELEGCVKWLKGEAMAEMWDTVAELASELHASRRPKPPSLKEQALKELHHIVERLPEGTLFSDAAILRALESLPD